MFYNDNFINIGKDIYVYKNFIDEKECNSIVSVVENLSNDEWQTLDDNTFVTKPLSEIKLIKEKFIKIVNNKLQLGKGSSVVKMNTGASLGRHYDDYDFKDSKENIVYGLVLYLNYFKGGEIYYPSQNIKYKPNPGDLLIHSSKIHCLHEVKPVISGPRYCYSNHVMDNNGS